MIWYTTAYPRTHDRFKNNHRTNPPQTLNICTPKTRPARTPHYTSARTKANIATIHTLTKPQFHLRSTSPHQLLPTTTIRNSSHQKTLGSTYTNPPETPQTPASPTHPVLRTMKPTLILDLKDLNINRPSLARMNPKMQLQKPAQLSSTPSDSIQTS